MWSVYYGETRTGRVIDEVPFTKLSWSNSLDIASRDNVSVTVPLEPFVAGRLRALVDGSWRYTLIVCFNETAIFAGPVLPWKHQLGATVTIDAGDVATIFGARLVITPGYEGNPNDVNADVIFRNTTLQNIARQLVLEATTGLARELPIVLPVVPVAGTSQRTYEAQDLASAAERLEELSEVTDGPDIVFEPTIDHEAGKFAWVLRIGSPHLDNTVGEPWHFDYDANTLAVTIDSDPSKMVTQAYVPGEQQGDYDNPVYPYGIHADTRLVERGFPWLQRVYRDHASAKDVATLLGHAKGYVGRYLFPLETWDFTVRADIEPVLPYWRVGDHCELYVFGHPWIEDGGHVRRIVARSGDETERVTISTAATPGQGPQ